MLIACDSIKEAPNGGWRVNRVKHEVKSNEDPPLGPLIYKTINDCLSGEVQISALVIWMTEIF